MEDVDLKNIPNTLCRTCLCVKDTLKSIFSNEHSKGLEVQLSEMICACTTIEITIGDGLPEEICSDCINRAVDMYLFKLQCEENDKFLRKRLHSLKPPVEISTLKLDESGSNTNNESSLLDQELLIDTKNSENTFEYCFIDEDGFSEESNDQSIYTDINVASNVTTKKKTKDFECEMCFKMFSREDLLLRHKIAHVIKMNKQNDKKALDKVEEESDDSDSITEDRIDEKKITIKAEEDMLYSCDNSDSIFLPKHELDDHLLTDHKDKKSDSTGVEFVCNLCFKKFKRFCNFKRHLRIHSADKLLKCEECGKKFNKIEQLNTHMNNHTGIRPYTCKICCKGFNQLSNLKDHTRTHNGEKPFLCSTCGKGFNQLGNLRQHTVRHSGVKAHLCTICTHSFASKGELSAHIRKHTGARPFVCSVCNRGFTTSSSLTKHKRIHSGERPYECDVCHIKFSRSGILSRHKRTHTGEKPYVCSFCKKAFTQSNDLKSHLRIHTGEKPYICEECGQPFRQSSALKTHKKTHLNSD